jgi:hypothetical protein
MVPAAAVRTFGTPIPLAGAPIGFMMPDRAAYACPKEAVVSDEMSGDAADHRSFDASGRL